MAAIGMQHVVVATIKTETEGSPLVYNKGRVVSHAVRGNLTRTRNNNPLYGDDRIVENDNGLTGYTLEVETTHLSMEERAYFLGLQAGTDGQYSETDEASPYVGCGYVRVLKNDNVVTYEATWAYKLQFAEGNEESRTKGENVEWKTPTFTGTGMGVKIAADGKTYFRTVKEYETIAEAVAFVDAMGKVGEEDTGA